MPRPSLPFSTLRDLVGESHVLTAPEELHCYSYDASKMKFLPECVVFPGTAEEVAQILRLANLERFPVYPRGAGTGMVGAALPRSGGVAMVMTRFNQILEIDQDNMIGVVEPGVITGEFQRHVSKYGLFYPPDPASLQFSTIGGNAAMCAGGPRAVKYGVTRDYVMGLQVVLPTGEIIRTGTRTQKGVVGYDLTRLMVGSEGTLGVFTQIILKLIPAPESVRTLLAIFPFLENAARAVSEIIRHRIIPSTLELMDQSTVQVVENYLSAGLPTDAEALLLIEVDGPDRILDDDAAAITDICLGCGASEVEAARSGEDRARLWKARRSISPALGQIRPDKINEDVTVPRTQIPALIQFIRFLAEKYHLTIVSFGHAGDGNIHTNIMLDKSDKDEARRAEMAVEELFRAVLTLGGTLSGEHGVGIAKSPFFEMEIGREGLQAMLKIKQALDPNNILNPGKMFIPDRAFFNR